MKRVISQAKLLADELNNCEELTLLKELTNKIGKNPPLKNKISEYKKMSIQFETKKIRGLETDFEEEKLIGRIYAEIMLHEDGKRYLDVENNLFDILNNVYEIIDNTEFALMQKSLF